MKLAAKVFGALAGLLLLILLLGLLLPGTWEAEADLVIQAPPDRVFSHMEGMEAFSRWFPSPGSGLEFFGPARGVGSGMRWDDPTYGQGEVTITDAEQNASMAYRVLVEGGALDVQGILTLTEEGDGTRIFWKESGDFGWNPILGFTARGMSDAQGAAMLESLKSLDRLMAEGETETQTPSAS